MTTNNNEKLNENVEVLDSTELLMEESKKAALAEEQAAEKELPYRKRDILLARGYDV